MASPPVPHVVADATAPHTLLPRLRTDSIRAPLSRSDRDLLAGLQVTVMAGSSPTGRFQLHAPHCLDSFNRYARMEQRQADFDQLASMWLDDRCIDKHVTQPITLLATAVSLLVHGITSLYDYTLARSLQSLAAAADDGRARPLTVTGVAAVIDRVGELADQARDRLREPDRLEPWLLSTAIHRDRHQRLQPRNTHAELVWSAHGFVQYGAAARHVAGRYGTAVAAEVADEQDRHRHLLDAAGWGWLARPGWRQPASDEWVRRCCRPTMVDVYWQLAELLSSDVVGSLDGRVAFRLPRWVIDPLNTGDSPADVLPDEPPATVATALSLWSSESAPTQYAHLDDALGAARALQAA